MRERLFRDGIIYRWNVRRICRLGENPRIIYNLYKRVQALKLQTIIAPNGLVANTGGAV